MKPIRASLQVLCVSAGLFGLVGCDSKPAASSAPAVVTLRKRLEEVKSLKEAGDAALETDPMGMLLMLRQESTQLASLPTEGLPADLKAGVENAKKLFWLEAAIIIGVITELPPDEEGDHKPATDLKADPNKATAFLERLKADSNKETGLLARLLYVDETLKVIAQEKDALKAELDPLFKKYDLPTDFLND